jgi:uncharacterized repeat protein (TIGR03843 family)
MDTSINDKEPATGLFSDKQTVSTILEEGKVNFRGQFNWSSNYTFLVDLEHPLGRLQAVYKPTRGERPLWDFPARSLAKREVAAYLLSEALGWHLVPPTIYRRRKLPLGVGSVQLFIPNDPDCHYFNFTPEDKEHLRPIVLFDLITNNADRKGSHIIKDAAGKLWAIDHGICFHREYKLRTVIWDFAGQPIPKELVDDIGRVLDGLSEEGPVAQQFKPWLKVGEIKALRQRMHALIGEPVFPLPDPNRRYYPFPLI